MNPLSTERRSENMRRIRSKDTNPELVVRRLVHSMGYRYRLHVRSLPGKPDLVFPKYKAVIFVHGCFWHLHPSCREGRIPRSNSDYWGPKLTRNVARDQQNQRDLKKAGWRVQVLWECNLESDGHERLKEKVRKFLSLGEVE